MAQTLRVSIIGDAASYGHALKQSESATSRFGSSLKKLGLIAVAGTAAVGAAAVVIGKKSVEAAINAQEANDKLTVALKNQGIQMTALSPAILDLEASARKLGFANEDTRAGLTKLVQSGKSYGDAVTEMGVAQDLARAKGIALGDATTSLIRLQAGNIRAAKEFGIVLPPVTAAVDKLKASHVTAATAAGAHAIALAKVQDKLATGQAYYANLTQKIQGQGEAYSKTAAGGIAQFHAALGNLEEQLGSALAPALGRAASALGGFIDKFSQAQGASAKFHVADAAVAGAATDTFNALKAAFAAINWNAVWADVKLNAQALVDKMQSALSNANWSAIGGGVGTAIVQSLHFADDLGRKMTSEIAHAAANVDWNQALIGLVTGLRGDKSVPQAVKDLWLKAFKLSPAGVAEETGRKVGTLLGKGAIEGFTRAPIQQQLHDKLQAEAVAGMTTAVKTAAAIVVPTASAAATQIGAAMAQGAAAGLRAQAYAMAQAAVGMVLAAIASMQAALGIHSPSKLTADQIGKPMVEGIAAGIIANEGLASTAAARATQKAVAAAQAALILGSPAFAAAAGALGLAGATALVRELTGPGKTKVQVALEGLRQAAADARAKFVTTFQGLADAALAAFDAKVAAWVNPFQKKLDAMQRQDQITSEQQGVATAQTGLVTATTAATTAANDLTTALASGDAEAIATAQQAKSSADQAVIDAQAAIVAAQRVQAEGILQRKADDAAKAHEAESTKQRQELIKELNTTLDTLLKNHNKMSNYMADSATAARRIADALHDALKDLGAKTPGKAAGGPVGRGRAYIVGERGPELFVPGSSGRIVPNGSSRGTLASGGGGTTVQVHVAGSVVTENELADSIYQALLRRQGRNGTLGFA